VSPRVRASVPRTALVIGNGAYAAAPLRNAVADARLIASTLRDLQFDVVLLENAGLDRMLESVRRWVVGGTGGATNVSVGGITQIQGGVFGDQRVRIGNN
jgi:hypothetical protein